MLKSERKSLIRFLVIYLGSTFSLFLVVAWLFYFSQKHHLLDQQREELKSVALELQNQLRTLHSSSAASLIYPTLPEIQSSIYDLGGHYIFGSEEAQHFERNQEYTQHGNRLYYLAKMEPYYLGAAFLLVSRVIDQEPIESLQKTIIIFLVAAALLFSLLGLFLGRLFVAPMRESMERLNHFIQDTTHELNTPIATILTNIELLEDLGKCKKSQELQRIEIASKTLSQIYEDLTYLNLNHHYHRALASLDMAQLIEERLLYFASMIENKQLRLESRLDGAVIVRMDRNDATRLVDNLLSNAIKYNKPEGLLKIALSQTALVVEDRGYGIKEEDVEQIMCRFTRANKSEGGFGIGLDIVNQIVERYGFDFQIDSEYGEKTEVKVTWER